MLWYNDFSVLLVNGLMLWLNNPGIVWPTIKKLKNANNENQNFEREHTFAKLMPVKAVS